MREPDSSGGVGDWVPCGVGFPPCLARYCAAAECSARAVRAQDQGAEASGVVEVAA